MATTIIAQVSSFQWWKINNWSFTSYCTRVVVVWTIPRRGLCVFWRKWGSRSILNFNPPLLLLRWAVSFFYLPWAVSHSTTWSTFVMSFCIHENNMRDVEHCTRERILCGTYVAPKWAKPSRAFRRHNWAPTLQLVLVPQHVPVNQFYWQARA